MTGLGSGGADVTVGLRRKPRADPPEGAYRCAECGHGDRLYACAGANVAGRLLPDGTLTEDDVSQHTLYEGSIECEDHPGADLERWFGGAWTRWVPCTWATMNGPYRIPSTQRCDNGRRISYAGSNHGPCPACNGNGGIYEPVAEVNSAEVNSAWTLVYHVPRSQVWDPSRGGQSGAVHLHASDDIAVTAKRGRCGTLTRPARRSLCGKHGWYERPVEHHSDLQLRCAECERRATRYGIDWPTAVLMRLQGTCQRTLEIRTDVAAEVANEPPTRYVRIAGQGPRGGEAALGLYLSPRVEDLQRFAAGAQLVAAHQAWLSIIAYTDGTLRIEREPGRRAGWLRVRFRTTQGRVAWTDLLPPDVSDELLQALENAATHLAGAAP